MGNVFIVGGYKQDMWSYSYRVHKIIKDAPKLIKKYGVL